jgi:hypothetical protein
MGRFENGNPPTPTQTLIYSPSLSTSMLGRKMPRNYEPIANPAGTTVYVTDKVRNKIARIAQEQGRGISETSIELSELWLMELNKRYPQS